MSFEFTEMTNRRHVLWPIPYSLQRSINTDRPMLFTLIHQSPNRPRRADSEPRCQSPGGLILFDEMGIKPRRIAYCSPWQNCVAERWLGSCRRALLGHVVVFGRRRLVGLIRSYKNATRCEYDGRLHDRFVLLSATG